MRRIGPDVVHGRRQAFRRSCDYFSLDPAFVESTLQNESPRAWSEAFGGGQRGGRAASSLAISLARVRCAECNHAEEARLGLAAARDVLTDEAASYRDAWVAALSGVGHQCESAKREDQVQLAKELGELAFAALNDLDARFARPGFPPASQDRQLDAIVIFLLQSEQTIGSVLSPLSADLERRTRNRNLQKRAGKNTSFAQIRYKGIKQVWAAERLGWFRKRYEEKTGQPAPDDFTVNSRFVPGGWQISDEYRKRFERSDYQDFMRDMDALYRRRNGLPAKGEGWLAQIHLTKCVEEVLPGYEIIREAKAPWLGAQRLDVYVPAFKVAIEYQGQQHYFPLEIWGGEQGLKDRQALDKTKRNSCKEAGVILIEWSYKEPISPETVRSKLKACGLFPEFGPA